MRPIAHMTDVRASFAVGTVTSNEPEAAEAYTELEVRSLTGAGAEGAVTH